MASLRQRFFVGWDDGEPVEILTTVADLIAAVDRVPDESVNNRIALNTTLIYAALERLGFNPPPYEEWLNLLDSYEEVHAPKPDPTPPDPSPTEPSPSPSSPEPTGDPGSPPNELLLRQNKS